MAARHYQAVLFDFDGTLYDTWPALCMALQSVYRQYNPAGDASFITQLRADTHLATRALLSKVLGVSADQQHETDLIACYQNLILEYLYPFPGLQDLLDYLNRQNLPWGIVTNKRKYYFPLLMAKQALLKTAACIVCPEDVQNRKPDPEPLLKACDILQIQPQQALYVGDNLIDVISAEKCHMDFALAEYGYSEVDTLAHKAIRYRLANLLDLKEIVFGQV